MTIAAPPKPTFPTVPELFADFRTLAYQVAPELHRTRLYLLETPADYPQLPPGCLAFAADPQDYRIRQTLIDAGEWQGPGIALVLNNPNADRAWRMGLLLHELAHYLPVVDPLPDRELTDAEKRQQDAELAEFGKAALPPGLPPWAEVHEWPFIRNCLHLHYRAERLGHSIPLPSLRFTSYYGMGSSPLAFKRALGDEPKEAWEKGYTFGNITRMGAPAEFLNLWWLNVATWYLRRAQ